MGLEPAASCTLSERSYHSATHAGIPYHVEEAFLYLEEEAIHALPMYPCSFI